MILFDDIVRFLRGDNRNATANRGGSANPVPPLAPEDQEAALHAVRDALAPTQSDEAHLKISEFGEDGGVLQHREEWVHEPGGLKAVTTKILVATCTGELVEPKRIRVRCLVCGGYDSVVAHCHCGVALCRRCLRLDPTDGTPLCPIHLKRALETFNTWIAQDQQNSKRNLK